MANRSPLPVLALATLGAVAFAFVGSGVAAAAPPADLILHDGRVWTVDPARPEAQAVAVSGERILRVGSSADVLALKGPKTEVVDLRGRLVLPGFNDAHTHLGNAAEWLFKVGLYDVDSSEALLARVKAAASRVPKGLWISGGDFGAAAAWTAESRGQPPPAPFAPTLAELDAAVPDHPVLLKRHDGAWLVNSLALARARFSKDMPDPRGGRFGRDPQTGALTGLLHGRAGERVLELMPPLTLEAKLVGARAALADLRRLGITSIADVTRDPALADRRIFHTDVERSSTDVRIFRELQRRGELSVRVYAFLSLPLVNEVKAAGIRPRTDDGRIRYGALKGFVDGFLMDEPYADNPRWSGAFTFRFVEEATMAADIAAADAAGYDPVVHATGDRAHRLLLDWYEAALARNPARDRRFRVIHAWYPSASDVARMGRMRTIVDITPNHLVRTLRTVDRALGPERAKTAHAWQSLRRAGARLNIVSDWPGSYNEQEPTPLDPLENIALAVTRQDPHGRPAGGWRPDERLTVEQAIEAYTINPAFSSYEEDRKGSVTEGKLADLVVLSRDILSASPAEIRATKVDLTVLGGSVIHRRTE